MIRRLAAEELAHTEARPIADHLPRDERARARAVVDELLPFLEGELGLSATQVDDLTLTLERALERALEGGLPRVHAQDGGGS